MTTPPSRPGPASYGRAHARRSVRLRALAERFDAAWKCDTIVENLGLGGACLVLREVVQPGEIVSVSFTAPALWDPLVLRGRIVWVTRDEATSRVGLAFEHQSSGGVLSLYELIVALAYE